MNAEDPKVCDCPAYDYTGFCDHTEDAATKSQTEQMKGDE
jgi:hypothetical protein